VYDTILQHLRTPTDRYHVVLAKIRQRFNIYTQDRSLLVSVLESLEAVRADAYCLGLCGHVTHLQLPLEMRHTAKIKTSLSE